MNEPEVSITGSIFYSKMVVLWIVKVKYQGHTTTICGKIVDKYAEVLSYSTNHNLQIMSRDQLSTNHGAVQTLSDNCATPCSWYN